MVGGGGSVSLPAREQDLDYQRRRVAVFRRLLRELPASRDEVVQQACFALGWLLLLCVSSDCDDVPRL
jgi:hypothetical protein